MSEIIKSYSGKYLQSGIFPGLPQDQPPLWEDGANVLFTEFSAQPLPAQYILTRAGVPSAVRGVLETLVAGVKTIFFATATTIYKWDQAGGLVTLETGFSSSNWTGFRWGTWIVLAPWPTGIVQLWKPGDITTTDLGGRGTVFSSAKIALSFGLHAIYINLDTDSTRIAWSSQDDVEQYVKALDNQAGSLSVREAESPLTSGLSYAGCVYFTTTVSLYRLNYLGPNNYFGYERAVEGFGAFAPGCLAAAGDSYLYGFGQNGIWQSDGQTAKRIDIPAIHDKIYTRINPLALDKCHAYHDAQTTHVFFYYPADGSLECNEAVGFNYVDGNWAPCTLHRTVSADSGAFASPLLGDVQGNIWAQVVDNTPIGASSDPSIDLNEDALASWGYGEMGYGEGGYGGEMEVES